LLRCTTAGVEKVHAFLPSSSFPCSLSRMAEPVRKQVADVLTAGSEYLAKRGVENPGLVCKLLLSRLLGCKHLELPVRFAEVLGEEHLAAMRRGIKRVGDGEPVQYVIGEAGFMGHTLRTDKRALIPRPETETLVRQVLDWGPLWRIEKPRIVDIGTGSGCIVISLALERPGAVYAAFDASPEALALARENAAALGVAENIAFCDEDLSEVIEPQTTNAVVSNPPYVATADYEKLPANIRLHEPREALDGGPTGLSVIESIIQDSAIIITPGGAVFLEIGETQSQEVTSLLEREGFEDIAVARDLAGRPRVLRGVMPA